MIGRAWRRVTRNWRNAAAIIAEEQALALTRETWDKTPVPPLTRGGAGQTPGAGRPAGPRLAAHPAPGPGHGGVIRAILVYADGRTEITRHPGGGTQIIPGDCPACTDGTCALCAVYTVWDTRVNRWVRRYQKCPAHGRELQP